MWAILMFGIWYMKGYHLRHPVPDTGSEAAIVLPPSEVDEKDEKDVSPGQTTPSDSIYRLDTEKVPEHGVQVETERKSLDVGLAAGVGDGVSVAYDLAAIDEARKQARA